MASRLRTLGIVLTVIGLIFAVAGGVAYSKVQDGYGSLQAFSEAQNVTLSYNEDGQLIDRGTTEEAQAIKELLTDDWGYAVVESDLDPNDPLVNTASEYMFIMATIGYHVLHGTQTVVLAEAAEFDGEVIAAGTYEVPVDGRYWTDFDRTHPLDGPARSQAWTGTAHGLFGKAKPRPRPRPQPRPPEKVPTQRRSSVLLTATTRRRPACSGRSWPWSRTKTARCPRLDRGRPST